MLKPAIALLLALGAVPSLAQPGPEPRVEAVFYGDLDLASDAGIAQLDRRIAHAVARVCGTAGPRNLRGRDTVLRCRAAAQQGVADRRAMLLAEARERVRGTAIAAR